MFFILCFKLFSFFRYLHFFPDFLVMQNGLIRKLRLISKFMTSQTGQRVMTIHILSNFSRSICDQSMKFGQLTKCNVRIFSLKNHAENEAGELAQIFFWFLKKFYLMSTQMVSTFALIYFGRLSLRHTVKTNFITLQIVDPEVCLFLIFS